MEDEPYRRVKIAMKTRAAESRNYPAALRRFDGDASRRINIRVYSREKLQTINCFEIVEHANPPRVAPATADVSREDNVRIHHTRGNYDLHLNVLLFPRRYLFCERNAR